MEDRMEVRYGRGVSRHFPYGVEVGNQVTGALSMREARTLAFQLAKYHGVPVVRIPVCNS